MCSSSLWFLSSSMIDTAAVVTVSVNSDGTCYEAAVLEMFCNCYIEHVSGEVSLVCGMGLSYTVDGKYATSGISYLLTG